MHLIIVESPTKSNTIKKFLGREYSVQSSYGHIRDLPKKELGVDIKHEFKPKYVIPPKSKKKVKALKDYASKSDLLILACDEDREGESIAWHLHQVLNGQRPYQRIVFHEITKQAIINALKNPRKIDMDLVDAQQARRILDRLVGYKLSPFLWKKIGKGLSAGRVQSVTVRLIVDREREIEKFKPEEFWTIVAELTTAEGHPEDPRKIRGDEGSQSNIKGDSSPAENPQAQNDKHKFEATLIKKNNKTIPKLGIKNKNLSLRSRTLLLRNKKQAEEIINELKGAEYKVLEIRQKEVRRNPYPPFTTSTLQQEAARRFGYSVKQTMLLAQKLYEKGLITYHRTDSVNLADQAIRAIYKFIEKEFGKKYSQIRKYKTKSKTAQEAHEAIRPTNISRRLDDKLYDLIWRRTVASQMASAILDSTTVDIAAKKYIFRATGSVLKFDGFLKVYPLKTTEIILPKLSKDEILKLIKLIPNQHFTQPLPRYTEATLVKTLEKYGIGRPSTYAPIISTIQARGYVEKSKRKFYPREIGLLVNDLLCKHFPQIVDVKFTAQMENDLDQIAQGKTKWVPIVNDFYQPFEKRLLNKYQEIKKVVQKTKEVCPQCNKPMIIRTGRYGKFLACTGFPECKFTKPIIKSTGVKCPECNKGEVVEKRTRKGKIFWSCNRYPECEYATWEKPESN